MTAASYDIHSHQHEALPINRIPEEYADTDLEKAVLQWINKNAENYENGVIGVAKDLFYGGCASGMVSEMCYYSDTVKFYNEHQKDIDQLLADLIDSTGESVSSLFKDWDESDPLCRDTNNQNLLAWFGFEEAARNICDRAGIEY